MVSNSVNIKALCEEFIKCSNEDGIQKVLIKLINIIKLNQNCQKELIIYLSDKGVFKVMSLIKNDCLEIRKLASKLMIEILYNNEILQNIFCEKFNFNPIGNAICLNWFPKILKEHVNIDANLINDVQSITNTKTSKYWIWPNNQIYNDENYPDPNKYLIGFFYNNKFAVNFATTSPTISQEVVQKIINSLESDNIQSENISKEENKIPENININKVQTSHIPHPTPNPTTKTPIKNNNTPNKTVQTNKNQIQTKKQPTKQENDSVKVKTHNASKSIENNQNKRKANNSKSPNLK